MKLLGIKNLILLIAGCCVCTLPTFALQDSASSQMSFVIPEYTNITPITNPVLTAHIFDDTGNLATPLSTQFRVITNASDKRTFYLKAEVNTDLGRENAMFKHAGRVYIAFGNMQNVPKSSSLANCKTYSMPKDSPGVVAYPVTSVIGAKSNFNSKIGKYEVLIGNGTTNLTINVGSNVLGSTFSSNDPKGAYQAVLSLTEADI